MEKDMIFGYDVSEYDGFAESMLYSMNINKRLWPKFQSYLNPNHVEKRLQGKNSEYESAVLLRQTIRQIKRFARLWGSDYWRKHVIKHDTLGFGDEYDMEYYSIQEVIRMCKKFVVGLANIYCPGDVEELKALAGIDDTGNNPEESTVAVDNSEGMGLINKKGEMPTEAKQSTSRGEDKFKVLQCGNANKIFKSLIEAGYLESDKGSEDLPEGESYYPNIKPGALFIENKSFMALMAKVICTTFGISRYAKAFDYWCPRDNSPEASSYKRRGMSHYYKEEVTAEKEKFAAYYKGIIKEVGINKNGSFRSASFKNAYDLCNKFSPDS